MIKQTQESGVLMKMVFLLIIALIIIVGFLVYKVIKGEEIPSFEVKLGEQLSEEQIGDLLGRISRLIMLPEETDPLIATINDAPALRAEQAFYRDAENGDQLVIFTKRAMAVIYRPSVDKLINVGPIFFDNAGTKPESIPTPTQPEVVQPVTIPTPTQPEVVQPNEDETTI